MASPEDERPDSKLPAKPTAGSLSRLSSIASATFLPSLNWFRSTDSVTALLQDEAQNNGDVAAFDIMAIGPGTIISHEGQASSRNTKLNTAHGLVVALPVDDKNDSKKPESISRNSSLSTAAFLRSLDWVWGTEPEVITGIASPSPGASPQDSPLIGSHDGQKSCQKSTLNMNEMPTTDDSIDSKLPAKPAKRHSSRTAPIAEWFRSTSLGLFRTTDSATVILKEEAKKSGIALDETLLASKDIMNSQMSKTELLAAAATVAAGANIGHPNEEPQTKMYADFMQEMEAACAPATNMAAPGTTSSKKKNNSSRKRKHPEGATNFIQNPTEHDVLGGRGGRSNNHPGNRLYLQCVYQRQERYKQAALRARTSISQEVVDEVHGWRGRFLDPVDGGGGKNLWYELDDYDARKKCSQALRTENTPEIRKLRRTKYCKSTTPNVE